MKFKSLLACFAIVCTSLFASGCASTGLTGSTDVPTASGSVTVPNKLVTVGYEIANFLQQFNTGVTAVLPSVDAFLQQTHNSKDAQVVSLYGSMAASVAGIASAGIKASLPPQQVQAAVNTVLAPPAVVATTANVVATTLPSN